MIQIIKKENLAIFHKSLKALFLGTPSIDTLWLQVLPTAVSGKCKGWVPLNPLIPRRIAFFSKSVNTNSVYTCVWHTIWKLLINVFQTSYPFLWRKWQVQEKWTQNAKIKYFEYMLLSWYVRYTPKLWLILQLLKHRLIWHMSYMKYLF